MIYNVEEEMKRCDLPQLLGAADLYPTISPTSSKKPKLFGVFYKV